MLAYGEVIGLVHVRLSADTVAIPEDVRQFTATMSEHLALALASLKLRETLRAQSVRDPLTGLFNRRFMQESLEREFARADRSGESVAVVMMDVDHFKSYNDTFGHEAGDIVLAHVGQTFQNSIRASDIACRYGGEEFVIILPGMDAAGAMVRAEQICQSIRNLDVRHQGRKLDAVSLSAGVAVYPQHGKVSEEVLNVADAALYEAKRAGRDRVMLASAGVDAA
jgi:diguanylate cyclase (GGDEF)-like protein